MIIGQFGDTFPPTLDGVGRVMMSYCDTLEKLGHRAPYISVENPQFHEDVPMETILYHSLPIPRQNYRLGVPLCSLRFRRQMRHMDFDVVHAHSPFIAGHYARRIARRRNIPLVATFHSKFYDDFYRATGSKTLARFVVRYVVRFFDTCDEVWAVGDKTAEVLRDYGYTGAVVTMPNGTNLIDISDDDRARARARFPLRPGVPTLMFTGQQDFKKNIETILLACAQLKNEGLDFQFVMVGEGPNAKEIRHIVDENGMTDRFTFTGFLGDRPLLLALYEQADLFVFPSLYDNAPMVVREAASMGTPALLIKDSCSSEGMTDGQNAFLCENSVPAVAACIRDALPRCREVGETARETIPIPWSKLMQEVLARYQTLIERKKARPSPQKRSKA